MPVTIGTSTHADATAYGHQRKVVRTTDAQNTLHVFFDDGGYIEWWRSIDGGQNWTQVASRAGRYASVIRDENNNLHMVYLNASGGNPSSSVTPKVKAPPAPSPEPNTILYYCTMAYNASAFGTERTLPALVSGRDVFGTPNINVAIIDSTAYVFVIVNQYSTAGAKHSDCWFVVSNDAGVTWYHGDMATTGWEVVSEDYTLYHTTHVPSCYVAVHGDLDLHAFSICADGYMVNNVHTALADYISTPTPHWGSWTITGPKGEFSYIDNASWVKETNDWVWQETLHTTGDDVYLVEWESEVGWPVGYHYRGAFGVDSPRFPAIALELTELDNAWLFLECPVWHANFDIVYRVWGKSAGAWKPAIIRVTDDNLGNHYVNVKEREDNSRMEFIYTKGVSSPFDVVFDYITVEAPPPPPGLNPMVQMAKIILGL